VYLDGQQTEYQKDTAQLIMVSLEKGEHTIVVRYQKPKAILVSYLISITAVGLLGYLTMRKRI
jgi:hypothetical protein